MMSIAAGQRARSLASRLRASGADQGAGIADRATMARVFSHVELAGALLIAVWIVLAVTPGLDRGWLSLVAVVAFVQALALRQLRKVVPLGVISGVLGFATGVVGLAIYFSGGALSPIAFFYLWVVAYCAWYLPRGHATLHVSWVIVSYVAVMLVHAAVVGSHGWQITTTDAARWLLLTGSVIATAFMVRTFRNTFLDHEQRFLLGFDRSSTPMAVAGLDRRLSAVNEAFCALVGRSGHELVGLKVNELMQSTPGAETGPSLADGRSPSSFETCFVTADGSTVWVHVAASLVTDRRGKPVHWFGQLLDITARREAEEQLRKRAARQEAIADLGQSALKGAQASELSDQVVATAMSHLGADLTAILEKDSSSDQFALTAWRDSGADPHEPRIQAGLDSLAAFTLAAEGPVFVEDWVTEARFQKPELEDGVPARSAISVLVRGRKRHFGVLIAESEQPHAFTIDDGTFLRSLANMLAEAMDERRTQEEIAHRALHDSLTGLPNRLLFADLLRHTLARSRRDGAQVALVLLDIDHFKLVNDSLGHNLGDDLLRVLTERLGVVLRTQDTLARFSADEFLILCDDVENERAAVRVTDRVLAAVQPPFQLGDEEISITATAGIAIATSDHTAEALIRDAEAAMHRAKERARGRYELFDSEMHERNIGRLRIESALRRAHKAGELYLAYQPLVSLATGKVESFEALLRWEHPDWGPISPVEFIPIAEESGLIIPIGRRVLTDTCDQLASWHAQHREAKAVAVNVSSRQLYDDVLPQFIRDTIARDGIPADLITLELTESTLVGDNHHAQQVLHELKEIGVRLALDDFGTGFASLSYLSSFPFDIVKLDRTLIKGIGQSRKDDIIIASTIEMGHALGLKVVAEGIETKEQAAHVKRLGCDLAQGFYFAMPLPASQILPES